MACAVLGCSFEDLQNLQGGIIDTTNDAEGRITKRGDIELPAKALRLIRLYAQFLRCAEVLPPRALPQEPNSELARVQYGVADPVVVAALRSNLKGFASLGARLNSEVTNLHNMQTAQVSIASLADYLGIPDEKAWSWVTNHSSVPLSDKGTAFWAALSFIAFAPQLRPEKFAGRVYIPIGNEVV
jgi:hypothetical protein